MASFCNKCTKVMFPKARHPDIDIEKISKQLKPSHSKVLPCECEGCKAKIIYKNAIGKVTISNDSSKVSDGLEYDEYWEKYAKVKE